MCLGFLKTLFKRSHMYLKHLDNKISKMEEKLNLIEEAMNEPDLFKGYKRKSLQGEHDLLVVKYNSTYKKYIKHANGEDSIENSVEDNEEHSYEWC